MPGLIKVKYKNFPTSHLFMLRSLEPSVLLNLANCSIGVCASLLAKNPMLERTFRVYFL